MSRKLNLSALAEKAETGNNSSVKRIEILNMNIDDLLLEEPFKSLFPIRDEIKEAIKAHMQEHGYDESKPVDVWKRPSPDGFEYVLVDGFTRVRAAREISRLTVSAYLHLFANAGEARDYAIHTQRDRRNLSDAEIMSILGVVDKKVTGFKGNSPFAPGGANGERAVRTAELTAKEIGTSTRKVERARTVSSDPEIAAAVKRGDLSINKGYNAIREREKHATTGEESHGSEDQSDGGSLDSAQQSISKTDIQVSAIESLRNVWVNKVALTFDETDESGHVSLWFENHDQLQKMVELFCSPKIANGRDNKE